MAQIYNLKIRYGGRRVSAVNSELCKIQKIGDFTWLYKFEDAKFFGKKFDWNEPVLEIKEHKDMASQITHLIFRIISWDGLELGRVLWGTNEFEVWQQGELEFPPSLNTGKSKAISINQIETPMITEAPAPGPSWWQNLSTFGKGVIVGGVALIGLAIFWKIKK